MSRANEPVAAIARHASFQKMGDGTATHIEGYVSNGLTIREHFAAMAMQGIQAQYTCQDGYEPANVARHAVIQADALLAELAK